MNLDAAAPFAVATVLALTGQVTAYFVERRLVTHFEAKSAGDNVGAERVTAVRLDGQTTIVEETVQPSGIPGYLRPADLGTTGAWAIDAAAALIAAIAPIASALLLVKHSTFLIDLGYVVALLCGLGLFAYVLNAIEPNAYHENDWHGLSIVVRVSVLLNVVIGLLVYFVA
jgi:hypothetical protein